MDIPVMLLLLLVSGLLQSVAPAIAAAGSVKIPFLCALVMYYALTRDKGMVAFVALVAGLMQDALGEVPLGYSSLCFLAVGMLFNRFRDVVFVESIMTPVFFGAIACALASAGIGLLLWKDGVRGAELSRNMHRLCGSAALGALCAPFVFIVAFKLDRLVGNVEAKRDVISEDSIRYT